ncbi:MAG: hypothetical protein ACJA17_000471 [Polaribacter sp.]|jgi:hypothetical protein
MKERFISKLYETRGCIAKKTNNYKKEILMKLKPNPTNFTLSKPSIYVKVIF